MWDVCIAQIEQAKISLLNINIYSINSITLSQAHFDLRIYFWIFLSFFFRLGFEVCTISSCDYQILIDLDLSYVSLCF